MKKILILVVLGILLISSVGIGSQLTVEKKSLHRGSFEAEIGIRENDVQFNLDGNFRDFRGRHILSGIISPSDSNQSLRFQGLSSRNYFIIQTGFRNNIVNIVGRFTEYDEDMNKYSGSWRGFVIGVGRTSGWITASLSS
ncbi:MAG: hypothetical protein QCI00_00145 [Candidatus Thermoplasmatota archaeon]|nr:hypothetical protein [Candidatus Thermoplasmatota archaeon]